MRIFVAAGIFHPDVGGPATHLAQLLPEIQARGHEVRVLAYGRAAEGELPYRLDRVPLGRWPWHLARYAVAYQRGARWADVTYVTSFALPRFLAARTPVVLRVAGDYAWERCVRRGWLPPPGDVDEFQRSQYGPIAESLKLARSREVRRADRVIVPSHYLRKMVLGWGAADARISVVPNAVDPAFVAAAGSQEEARDALGWNMDGRYVFCAARLTWWKGVDVVMDAMAAIPDVSLVVAGDGPQRTELQARAADSGTRVEFLGAVPHALMPLYLRASDYLVLYSGYEGLSHTILEALHAGTPVIASRRGGNPEIVRDGDNGMLVEHPNPAALRDALRRAFDGQTRAHLAAGARSGLERFSWTVLVEAMTRTFESMAPSARDRGRM